MGLSTTPQSFKQEYMMPSVAVFVNNHLPLSEIFIAQQARALTRYQPTLVACRQVINTVYHDMPTVILNHHDDIREKIDEAIFKMTGYAPRLQSAITTHDIVHAHFGPSGFLISPIAKRLNKHLVVTLHGFDVLKDKISPRDDGVLQTMYSLHRKKLAARADMFLCVSEFIKQKAIDFGFPAEKCVVHYLGIPIPPAPPPKTDTPSKSFRILSVGRLVPWKGHDILINAVHAVQQAGYDVHLDIIGGGENFNALQKQCAQKLSSYRLWGAQPHAVIQRAMNESDLFCHPSVTITNGQTEAFGLVLLEAQAAGLPVIAFRTGGVPEAVLEGKTALLAPVGDPSAMAYNIMRMIDDNNMRQTFSAQAPDFIRRRFDISQQAGKIETLYDTLIVHKKREA